MCCLNRQVHPQSSRASGDEGKNQLLWSGGASLSGFYKLIGNSSLVHSTCLTFWRLSKDIIRKKIAAYCLERRSSWCCGKWVLIHVERLNCVSCIVCCCRLMAIFKKCAWPLNVLRVFIISFNWSLFDNRRADRTMMMLIWGMRWCDGSSKHLDWRILKWRIGTLISKCTEG